MIVIEHNLDVIKTADWIVDRGPKDGTNGSRVDATVRCADELPASVIGALS